MTLDISSCSQVSVAPGWTVSSPEWLAREGSLQLQVVVGRARKDYGAERPTEEPLLTEGPVTVLSQQLAHIHLVREYLEQYQTRVAQRVFREILRFSENRGERVAGDLCADVVRKTVCDSGGRPVAAFIEGPARHRYVDRIASLRLKADAMIFFVSFDLAHTVTSIMSKEARGFAIDAYAMLRLPTDEFSVKGPYPGFEERATVRTYFVKNPQPAGIPYAPIRIDLVCPEDTEAIAVEKLRVAQEILTSDTESAPWFAGGESGTGYAVRLPQTLILAHKQRVDAVLARSQTGDWWSGQEPG